jgi:hypothetical protein
VVLPISKKVCQLIQLTLVQTISDLSTHCRFCVWWKDVILSSWLTQFPNLTTYFKNESILSYLPRTSNHILILILCLLFTGFKGKCKFGGKYNLFHCYSRYIENLLHSSIQWSRMISSIHFWYSEFSLLLSYYKE